MSEGTRFWGGPGSEGVAKTQVINTKRDRRLGGRAKSLIGDSVPLRWGQQ